MKKSAIFLLFFLFFIAGFLTNDSITKKKEVLLPVEKEMNQLKPQQLGIPQETQIAIQQMKAQDMLADTRIYFAQTSTPITSQKRKVTISMQSDKTVKTDATDLVLLYSDNLRISEILPGDAFSSYPRKITKDGVMTITGVTSFKAGIQFGESNKTFVTFIVEKTGDQSKKGTISIDPINTKVYLLEKSIFDESKSFKQIAL